MSDPASEWREERIARNEASFRVINERLEAGLRLLTPEGQHQPFICECGSRSCADTIPLTVDEYEAVRAHARHFAVLPGHVFDEAENVVERHDPRYVVVRKVGVGTIISQRTNPRGDDAADGG